MRSLGLFVACLVAACGGDDSTERDPVDEAPGGEALVGSVSATFRDTPFKPTFGIATFHWPELNPDGFGILLSTGAIDCANVRAESPPGYYVYAPTGAASGEYPGVGVLVMHLEGTSAEATGAAAGGNPGTVVLTNVTDARVVGKIDWKVVGKEGYSDVQGAFDVVRCP